MWRRGLTWRGRWKYTKWWIRVAGIRMIITITSWRRRNRARTLFEIRCRVSSASVGANAGGAHPPTPTRSSTRFMYIHLFHPPPPTSWNNKLLLGRRGDGQTTSQRRRRQGPTGKAVAVSNWPPHHPAKKMAATAGWRIQPRNSYMHRPHGSLFWTCANMHNR